MQISVMGTSRGQFFTHFFTPDGNLISNLLFDYSSEKKWWNKHIEGSLSCMRLIFEWVKVATDKVHKFFLLQIEKYLGSGRFGPKKHQTTLPSFCSILFSLAWIQDTFFFSFWRCLQAVKTFPVTTFVDV